MRMDSLTASQLPARGFLAAIRTEACGVGGATRIGDDKVAGLAGYVGI